MPSGLYTRLCHPFLVFTTFRKMLPNGLKLFGKVVDLVATFQGLFTNFVDGLEWNRTKRVLQNVDPAQQILTTILSCTYAEKTRWTYKPTILYTRNCRTLIVLETCGDVVWSGITWRYVFLLTGSKWWSQLAQMEMSTGKNALDIYSRLAKTQLRFTRTGPQKLAKCFSMP